MAGQKHDDKKLRYDLLPVGAIEDVVRVLSFGAKKYGDWNWIRVENGKNRYYAALQRHLAAWRKGYKKDKQSGKSHLAHGLCCLIFLLELEKQKSIKKNRKHPICLV